jgi:uncharacterized protein YcbX
MPITLSQLYLYPVKGCRGIEVSSATLAATGPEVDGIGDREWVIVDADGEFISQREYPKLARVETRLTPSSLRLKAPGMLQLEVPFASEGDVVKARVWDDVVAAVTQGEIADAWFSNFLGIPARLLRFDPEHTRLASHRWTGKDEAPYKFADAFPLLVTGTASLADLNQRLQQKGRAAVDMQRFRPNLVLSGLDAYEEDYLETLRFGEVTLRAVKPCARCSVPGVDPATGEHSTVVPDLLATYRGRTSGEPQGVMFGVNAIVTVGAGAVLHAGSAVETALRF